MAKFIGKPVEVEKAEEMLRAMGLEPIRGEVQPGDNWRVHFGFPTGSADMMEMVNVKHVPAAIVAATAVVLSPEHTAAYEHLDDDAKGVFLSELNDALNREFTEYQIQGMTSEQACPTRFEISTARYEDGLTLDSLSRTLASINKAKVAGIVCVRRHLGQPSSSGGGQFVFKRLGVQ